jgi:hypothetical protein
MLINNTKILLFYNINVFIVLIKQLIKIFYDKKIIKVLFFIFYDMLSNNNNDVLHEKFKKNYYQ